MDADNKFFYANGLEVAVSPFDFNLKFLRQGADSDAVGGAPAATKRLDEIIIGMSPAHAKAMLSGLFTSVSDYEKSFGIINLPNEALNEFNKTFAPLLDKK